jgi:hypothetical protein
MPSSPLRLTPLVAVICFAGLAACRQAPSTSQPKLESATAPWFEDITERSGVRFVHDTGAKGAYFMPENVGSGVALLDFDNDGRLDIYLVQNAGADSASRNCLFHQNVDRSFTDVSAGSGLAVAGRGMGVAIGDVNNDGWPDVLVTEHRAVRLFVNGGNGTFRELPTAESGLDNPLWAISACFVDYDRDGWLDLVVANYVEYDPNRPCFDEAGQRDYCGPKTFPPGTIAKLFHNVGSKGDAVKFEDVSVASGLAALPGPGLGVVCADFDGDGWQDIFVANDGEANRLWMNQRNGTFRDEAIARGVAFNAMGQAQGNMGIAMGDVDGDGSFDLFVTHLIEEMHALWTQSPRGLFLDRTASTGMAQPLWHGTGFGTALEDFDNDGAPDAAIANGAVRRNKLHQPVSTTIASLGPFWAPYAERNQLFANDGKGRFRDISSGNAAFCGAPRIARGLACGDLDGDGGVDLVISNVADAARVYRNIAANRGHWLLVRAVDPAVGGRDAYGSEITVRVADRHWTRWCNPGASYASSNDPRMHFGLGSLTHFDAVEVRWSDATVESFPGGNADQLVTLRKGQGTLMKSP